MAKSKYNLQLPIEQEVRDGLVLIAEEEGFDSVQSLARLILNKVARRQLRVRVVGETDEYLSDEAEQRLSANFRKAKEELYAGKTTAISSGDDLLQI